MGQGDKLQGTGLFMSLGLHWSAHVFLSWVDFTLIDPQPMLYFECLTTSILSGVWSGFKVSREQEPAQDELTEEVEKETIAK